MIQIILLIILVIHEGTEGTECIQRSVCIYDQSHGQGQPRENTASLDRGVKIRELAFCLKDQSVPCERFSGMGTKGADIQKQRLHSWLSR